MLTRSNVIGQLMATWDTRNKLTESLTVGLTRRLDVARRKERLKETDHSLKGDFQLWGPPCGELWLTREEIEAKNWDPLRDRFHAAKEEILAAERKRLEHRKYFYVPAPIKLMRFEFYMGNIVWMCVPEYAIYEEVPA